DHAADWIVEPEEEIGEGGLAYAAWSHERHHLALRDLQADVLENGLAVIAESNVPDGNAILERVDGPGTVLDLGRQIQELDDPARGSQRRLNPRGRARQQTDLDHHRPADVEKEERGGHGDPA